MKIQDRNMASKIFLDANIILDFVLKRDHYQEIKALFQLEQDAKNVLHERYSGAHHQLFFKKNCWFIHY